MNFISTSLIVVMMASIMSYAAPAEANVRHFEAQYTVPVTNASLQNIATFKLENYTVDSTNEALGQAEMEYAMPANLLGFEQTVKLFMTSKRQELQSGKTVVIREFSGRDSNAVCAGPWDKMRCEVAFNLQPDFVALEAMLKSAKDPLTTERLQIARVFSGDPIGITETK